MPETPKPTWQTRWLGREFTHHASLGSTNDEALAWASRGAGHGALVTADCQTTGRGTRGRQWVSPANKNVYASIVLRPEPTAAGGPQGLAGLGLAVGLGLRCALATWAPEIVLKWPNDLVTRPRAQVPSRKIAGVLCETRWAGNRAQIIVGFGVNVRDQAFPPEVDAIATSLAACVPGIDVGPREVLGRVLEHLEPVLEAFLWPSGGFEAIRERYQQHCITLGQNVSRTQQVRGVARVVTGQVIGLSNVGALRVRTSSGTVHTVQSVG